MKVNAIVFFIFILIIGLVLFCVGLDKYDKDTNEDAGVRKDYWEQKQNPITTYESGTYEVVDGRIQLRK